MVELRLTIPVSTRVNRRSGRVASRRRLSPLLCVAVAVMACQSGCSDEISSQGAPSGIGGSDTGGEAGAASAAAGSGEAGAGAISGGEAGAPGAGASSGEAGAPPSGAAGEAGVAGAPVAGEGGAGGAVSQPDLPVTIRFAAAFGAEPFDCRSVYVNVGADDASVRPVDFKLYVHDLRLIDEQGAEVPVVLEEDGRWQYRNVALLDFEDASGSCTNGTAATNGAIFGSVPAGSYRGIAFRLGVPFELNHEDLTALQSPLNLSSMYWSWNLGRLFLSLMTSAEVSATTRFESALHVGSTGCSGDAEAGGVTACERPNRAEFRFPDFRHESDLLVADASNVLRGSLLKTELCHSFTEDTCAAAFEALGLDWATGAPTPETQSVFRVVAPDEPGATYGWSLPKGFPRPVVPVDNPMSEAKVELGRHLFYDTRLSENGSQSCASCHRQELAFTDGGAVAVGSTGESHPRGAMSLANVAYATTLAWANPLLFTLEQQVLVPIFGNEPVELGMHGREAELIERLRAVPRYEELFGAAYPASADAFTLENVVFALASFERTLVSGNSPYDRYVYRGDEEALSPAARRGRVLFFSEKLECFHCHSGFNLQDSANFAGNQFPQARFHNTGLYNVDGLGAYPAPNTGVHEVSGRAEDMGRFRVPTLRNIAVTAPYMHDGSVATLDAVLDHSAAGGRTLADGPNAGDGSQSPLKSQFMIGFTLTPDDRAAVLAFLESLTDEEFLTDPRFANPWID
jgi:cytochrome c peroxidase